MVAVRKHLTLLLSYAPESGAGEGNRTVVSALARPSRPSGGIEPHPQMVSPAGVSPATWRLGRARSVL